MRVSISLAFALMLSIVGGVRAEPLNPKQVSAEAKWLVHLDADAMRSSVIAEKRHQRYENKFKPFAEQIEEVRLVCQAIDPSKNLKGVTLYSTQFRHDAGVLIVHTNLDGSALDSLRAAVQQLPDHAAQQRGSYKFHTWTHAKGTSHAHTVVGAYVRSDGLVFAGSADDLANALGVLDGSKPSLAGTSLPLAAAPAAGTLVLARVTRLPTAGPNGASPLINERADFLSLTLGETQKEAFLTTEIVAKDAKAAQEVKVAVENALASAMLTTDPGDVADVLNGFQVTSKDNVVVAEVRREAKQGCQVEEAVDKVLTNMRIVL